MLSPLAVESPVEGSSLDACCCTRSPHQWFYSLVGNDQIDDPWLDEAFVSYLTTRTTERSDRTWRRLVHRNVIGGAGSGQRRREPVYDYPPSADALYLRGGLPARRTVPGGAPEQLGDGPFWALLREHVAVHRNRVASPRAFLDRAQAVIHSAARAADLRVFQLRRVPDRRRPDAGRSRHRRAPWTGARYLFVAADFPVTRVQVWLDQRMMADGPANDLTLDLGDVEAGSYVLLVRVWDHDDVLFERAGAWRVVR